MTQPPGYPAPRATDEAPAVTNPFAPQPGDDKLLRGNVFIDAMDLLSLESFPIQVMLNLEGSLPTPCHQLRVAVSPADRQNQIQVAAYSLADPRGVCTQMLKPFAASVPLGSFSAGTYTVLVNGKKAGDISAP